MGTYVVRTAGMLMLLALAGPGAVTAQTPTGAIEGTITDAASGQPLNDAAVSVVGTAFSALTNTAGRYSLSGVPAGEHTVKVVIIGYATQEKQVTVTAGQKAVADFALEVAVINLDELMATGMAGAVERRKIGVALPSVGCCFFSGGKGDFNTESYAHIDENDFKLVSASPLSTFSIDVDRAGILREHPPLHPGRHPPAH